MDKTNTLLYLNHLLSTYTFMCKYNTSINKDIKKLNNYIEEFKGNNFKSANSFIDSAVLLLDKNSNTLFDARVEDIIADLSTSKDYNRFIFECKNINFLKLSFSSISLIEIPENTYTRYTHDVIIHQNCANDFIDKNKQDIVSNPALLKDFYNDRLSIFNQALLNYEEEYGVKIFNNVPPTVILSYESKENNRYNGAMYSNYTDDGSALIDIALKDEGYGTACHELFHLLEFEYTRLKYKDHQGRLISDIYYGNDFTVKNDLESGDNFLRQLRSFDLIEKGLPIENPITRADRLNILVEFFGERIDVSSLKDLDVGHERDRGIMIEVIFNNSGKVLDVDNKVLEMKGLMANYLEGKGSESFFHIESLFRDYLNNNRYYDEYSEKLARLAGFSFDKGYKSKPLPRGKEVGIYKDKFIEVVGVLRDEIVLLQDNKAMLDLGVDNRIELKLNKKSMKEKLNRVRGLGGIDMKHCKSLSV